MGIFVMPAGVTSVVTECWGWGSNGLGSPASGSGGGGGAYARAEALAVIPGDTYNLYDDGTSWYLKWVSGGDIDLVKGDGANPFFGPGFPGQAANCIGDVKYSGGAGWDTFGPSPSDGGGGGSGATRIGAGHPGAQPTGAASDDPRGGGGGDGGTGLTGPTVDGHDARGPAPGGGGGGSAWQAAQFGIGGLKRQGGGVVWLNSDWDYGNDRPYEGAVAVSSDGNFEPPPSSPKAVKRAVFM